MEGKEKNQIHSADGVEELQSSLLRILHIGINLSAIKDNVEIFRRILDEAMTLTGSDGGSIYLKEEKYGKEILTFKVTQNKSIDFPFKEFHLPIDNKSIAGYCAYSGQSYDFASMDEVEQKIGIKYNTFFDQEMGYTTCNMLVVPMKDLEGQTVGVLQLINKKSTDVNLVENNNYEHYTCPYTKDEAEVIKLLMTYGALLYERNTYYEDIKDILESFIEGMVRAIDQRDPITSGHSLRVALYARHFATELGFEKGKVKRIYYAGLLHDVGKIGIRERILLKHTRISKETFEALKYRLLLYRFERGLGERAIKFWLQRLENINKAGFLPEHERQFLNMLRNEKVTELDGKQVPLLSEEEYECLGVQRGNLTMEERLQMEAHAKNTYEMLKDITWGKSFKDLPRIAASHHEKLDGSGYYRGLKGDEIPLESRILAIVDIYEALTAIDRPYKPAMPVEKALAIITDEAERGYLDYKLVKFFIEHKIYQYEVRNE